MDWWEEREGVHAATLACIAAGLGDDARPAPRPRSGSTPRSSCCRSSGFERRRRLAARQPRRWRPPPSRRHVLRRRRVAAADGDARARGAATARVGLPRLDRRARDARRRAARSSRRTTCSRPTTYEPWVREVGPAGVPAPLVARDVPDLALRTRAGAGRRASSSWRAPGIRTSSTCRGTSRSRSGSSSGSSRSCGASTATSCASSSTTGRLYALKELPELARAARVHAAARARGRGDAGRRGGRRRQPTAATTSTPS